MKKYALIINEETKLCEVGLGTNTKFYQSIGMTEMEVEQAYNCQWYVKGFAPVKPKPDYEEVRQIRANLYTKEVDPITAHINRLRDEELTPEIAAEIAKLVEERKVLVEAIKASNPYPVVEYIEEIEELEE
jgi:hypothetical protein